MSSLAKSIDKRVGLFLCDIRAQTLDWTLNLLNENKQTQEQVVMNIA